MKKTLRRLAILIITLLIGLSLSSCELIIDFFEPSTGVEVSLPTIPETTMPPVIDKNWTNEELSHFINQLSIEIMKANVKVIAETQVGGLFNPEKKISQGSGVIFHQNQNRYYLLTNEHVVNTGVSGKTEYTIYDYKGVEYRGYILENSVRAEYDLAILYFIKKEPLKVLPYSAKNPIIGDLIISLGQPQGQLNTLTLGKIEKYVSANITDGVSPSFKVIRHNAPIDHGSSGGALLNAHFQIVGINFAGADDNEYALAVPVEKVIEYINTYFK